MSNLKWIESGGGPLVLICGGKVKRWSGVYKRSAYLANAEEMAEDLLNPDESDYGKACSVYDYLGFASVDDEKVLVLGDAPLPTAFFYAAGDIPLLARAVYAKPGEEEDKKLLMLDPGNVGKWEYALNFEVTSLPQFLFDAASAGNRIDNADDNYLQLDMKPGRYQVSTAIYEPDHETQLVLHRFELMGQH